jgi:hypothetical protein
MTDDVLRDRIHFAVAAQLLAISCESCEKREFDFYLHDTFVCESCAL